MEDVNRPSRTSSREDSLSEYAFSCPNQKLKNICRAQVSIELPSRVTIHPAIHSKISKNFKFGNFFL